jgi:hypothetical protein
MVWMNYPACTHPLRARCDETSEWLRQSRMSAVLHWADIQFNAVRHQYAGALQ